MATRLTMLVSGKCRWDLPLESFFIMNIQSEKTIRSFKK